MTSTIEPVLHADTAAHRSWVDDTRSEADLLPPTYTGVPIADPAPLEPVGPLMGTGARLVRNRIHLGQSQAQPCVRDGRRVGVPRRHAVGLRHRSDNSTVRPGSSRLPTTPSPRLEEPVLGLLDERGGAEAGGGGQRVPCSRSLRSRWLRMYCWDPSMGGVYSHGVTVPIRRAESTRRRRAWSLTTPTWSRRAPSLARPPPAAP